MPVPKTGRQINLERLHQAIRTATTADLQRAAMFLEGARQVRSGSKVQRSEQESEAAIKDQQVWQAAVQARLDGRARNRANALKTSDQSEQAA